MPSTTCFWNASWKKNWIYWTGWSFQRSLTSVLPASNECYRSLPSSLAVERQAAVAVLSGNQQRHRITASCSSSSSTKSAPLKDGCTPSPSHAFGKPCHCQKCAFISGPIPTLRREIDWFSRIFSLRTWLQHFFSLTGLICFGSTAFTLKMASFPVPFEPLSYL